MSSAVGGACSGLWSRPIRTDWVFPEGEASVFNRKRDVLKEKVCKVFHGDLIKRFRVQQRH